MTYKSIASVLHAREVIFNRDYPETFAMNTVYKTHRYPPSSLPNNVKLIFLFGNPMDIALSCHIQINQWGKSHYRNMQSDKFRENTIALEDDSLGLIPQFDSWYKEQSFDFLSVKYDNLFEQQSIDAISEYLGFPLKLPKYRRRKTNWTKSPHAPILLKTYQQLNDRIEKASPFRYWSRTKST
jgi:hypothetical protein